MAVVAWLCIWRRWWQERESRWGKGGGGEGMCMQEGKEGKGMQAREQGKGKGKAWCGKRKMVAGGREREREKRRVKKVM